jgi:hypothetical protein
MSSRFFPFAKTLLVFVLVGPPVGSLTFMGAFAAAGMTRAEGATALDAVWIMLFAMIYAVPLSYLIGALPAAIAGAIIGGWRAWRGHVPWWTALAVGLAAGLWLFAAGGGPFPEPTAGNRERGWQAFRLFALVATCLVPTMLCWALTRSAGRKAPPR